MIVYVCIYIYRNHRNPNDTQPHYINGMQWPCNRILTWRYHPQYIWYAKPIWESPHNKWLEKCFSTSILGSWISHWYDNPNNHELILSMYMCMIYIYIHTPSSKTHINGQFSIAMFLYQRICITFIHREILMISNYPNHILAIIIPIDMKYHIS